MILGGLKVGYQMVVRPLYVSKIRVLKIIVLTKRFSGSLEAFGSSLSYGLEASLNHHKYR